MKFRTNNPVYSKLEKESYGFDSVSYEAATYGGVTKKSLYFVLLVVVGAFLGIFMLYNRPEMLINGLVIISIATFISAIVAFMKPDAAKIAGSIYSLLQGIFVGVISLLFETNLQGVVFTALLGTVMVIFVVSTLYFSRIVKVNGKFMRFLLLFSISTILTYFIVFILSLIIPTVVEPLIANIGVSILIPVVMIFLASLYLMFDLEQIRQVVEGGQPKNMEWYVAFGLIYTIIWLYIQILRLVAIIMSRDR